MNILDFVTKRPRTKRELAALSGIPAREVEQLIQEARLNGAPICSDAAGYWLGDSKEVAACAEALRRRLVSQFLTSRAMRRTARRLEGISQTSLWGGA